MQQRQWKDLAMRRGMECRIHKQVCLVASHKEDLYIEEYECAECWAMDLSLARVDSSLQLNVVDLLSIVVRKCSHVMPEMQMITLCSNKSKNMKLKENVKISSHSNDAEIKQRKEQKDGKRKPLSMRVCLHDLSVSQERHW
jgi:hypothetical protein